MRIFIFSGSFLVLSVTLTTSLISVDAFQNSISNLSIKNAPIRMSPRVISPLSLPSSSMPPSSLPSSSSSILKLEMSSTSEEEPKRCPVTIFANFIERNLSFFDNNITRRILRLANHTPALLSLSYFGLVSMASMMSMGPMAASKTTQASATLASVLTKSVGATTNAQFAALFPTYVTPAPFVFLVWPAIAISQLLTVLLSVVYPSEEGEILTQNDLSSLTLANLCSTAWLISSSNAMAGSLPISSFLILPLVPLFSGFTLRNKPKFVLWSFQLFSSFTTLASILAFTVELQHGGRIPIIGTLGPELAACVFLSIYSTVALGVKYKSMVKRWVNFLALSGIVVRRVTDVLAGTTMFGALGGLFTSISFLGTLGCWYWSFKSMFRKQGW